MPDLSTDALLTRISSLLFFHEQWHARMTGTAAFYSGDTPRAAMLACLGSAVNDIPAGADNEDLFA